MFPYYNLHISGTLPVLATGFGLLSNPLHPSERKEQSKNPQHCAFWAYHLPVFHNQTAFLGKDIP